MIPAALASQLHHGLADFLRMSFWSSTPGMEGVIEGLISTPGAILKGPYVSVKLPFQRGEASEFFPELPLGFPAHFHQELAFERLCATPPRSTLIATGTGSGKTESFLWPILDHCRKKVEKPGIKGILIYPMNALATDQAGRIAKVIHANPQLRGSVRVGLYIGESPGEKRSASRSMGPVEVITDRKTLQINPPDILLTNYKMLDYLLIRPADQELWQHNQDGALRYLVVDELHTFDGAQGTDLACLIRRLKARLGVEEGGLCCIGTSATLGGGEGATHLRRYAEDIFGEDFDEDAVVREHRVSSEAFFSDHLVAYAEAPSRAVWEQLEPSGYPNPAAFVVAQQGLWFADSIDEEPGSEAWRVALGEQLMGHGMLRNLINVLGEGPVSLSDLSEQLGGASRTLRDDPELARLAVVSFLSLVSEARCWRSTPEVIPRQTRPFLEVRLQLWQRELARMVADVSPQPTLRFSDDLTEEQHKHHLPLVHCRECGAMGWATLCRRDKPDLYRTGLRRFYTGFFGDDPQVRFLWPAASAPTTGTWKGAARFPLERATLIRVREEDFEEDTVVRVVVSNSVITEKGQQKLVRDCPFCAARGSLTLVGFRANTLTSLYIDQLFASTFNDDKKLLTFSDSVQDASHRAGFYGARTWRFNLRVALQKVLLANEGISLEALPDAFVKHWRAPHRLSDTVYLTTFLAPNMDWLSDYELLQRTGELPEGSTLLREVDRRIAFEIFTEFGLQTRIGRSLSRTGSAAVRIDAVKLESATQALLAPLQNEIGGLRSLDHDRLLAFLLGALHHLVGRGGLLHRELPIAFVETGGGDSHAFKRALHLPSLGPKGRFPTLLTNDSRSPRFDGISKNSGGWYQRWVERCFGGVSPLIGEASEVWEVVLPVLTQLGLLQQRDGKKGRVWGVRPAALSISTQTVRLCCEGCGHWLVITAEAVDRWSRVPCLSTRCEGHYARSATDSRDYFGHLYDHGEVERVFTAEHTGLLSRGLREEVEKEFKALPLERKPWFPNLLSCTPTLEMGIDIGALSTAVLCSVPPTQANYLQRIGRAGRRDGNSLLLTMASAKPHDLHFFAQPEAMLAGEVSPPGIFLNASAVLERQLAAFSLDRWNAAGVPKDAIPRRLGRVFDQLEDEGTARFPYSWLSFVSEQEEMLLTSFFGLFGDRVKAESRQHLRAFLMGDREDEGSLGWKVLELLRGERKQRNSLRSKAQKVKVEYDKLQSTKAKSKDHEEQLRELQRERYALTQLVKQIQGGGVLQFLTDQGLLPNYAFPESPIRLRSVIWRKKLSPSKQDKSPYQTQTYEYARPAMAAISELAPENRFFAGGRHVTIDQVDVSTATLETWRFCDQCSYSARIDIEDLMKDCPSCGSVVWGEESQKGQVLKLEQVFANTHDKDSRIRDDQEQRQPRHYNRRMLMSFDDKDRDGAWKINEDSVPFAFEYLRRARFREINFGVGSEGGSAFSIAGREEVRPGFVICRHCGKVQPKAPTNEHLVPPKPAHTLWCSARKKGPEAKNFSTAVYLYREFSSEAIRLLLPLSEIGTDRQLNSFLAAFQLGLRDKYGGRVDHLQTLVYNEPEQDGELRRQYLVLFDTVPGGTGYLKDFTRETDDAEEEHPLLDILRRSLYRMRSCVCCQDPELDGCYQCLFAYRNSREMLNTSRSVAVELFDRIHSHAGHLQRVNALSDVSVSGLMDSVLEARFIEALRSLGSDARPVHLEKKIVRNKPGFRLEVGGRVWLIEQQLELGAAEGVRPSVSVDFVFHPSATHAGQRSIAVFLDGFRYHRDRVGHDMLQRMTLLGTGRYDVWTFTWYDIDEAFHRDVQPAQVLVHPNLNALAEVFRKLGRSQEVKVFQRSLLEGFLEELSGEEAGTDWSKLATGCLFAQMRPPGTVEVAEWRREVEERLPPSAAVWFDTIDPSWYLVHRPPTVDCPFGLWAAAPPAALLRVNSMEASDFRALVWLDDTDERQDAPGFREFWRGYLHAFHFLRGLPHGWFLSAKELPDLDLLSLSRQGAVCSGTAEWGGLEVEPAYRPLIEKLSAYDLDIPEVGLDLPDVRGHTSGLEGELVWEALRCAVVESLADASRPVDPDWKVFELHALLVDIDPLLLALGGS